MKKLTAAMGVCLLNLNVSFAEPQKDMPTHQLDCMDEISDIIPLLGRGSGSYSFVVEDIGNILTKQHPETKIISVVCTSSPKVAITTDGDSEKPLLTALKVNFPLQVVIEHNNKQIALDVEHGYQVTQLDTPDKQQVTQNFTVNSQRVSHP